ncbi:MAG: hypothetical protein FWE09_08470 [Treponema sp.]|nr:hypothetical protein [Treponema sp.]
MKKLLNLAGADWSVGNKVHHGIDRAGQGLYTPVVSVERRGQLYVARKPSMGIYMKTSKTRTQVAALFLIALCVNLSGCPDYYTETEIIVVNESSYDSRIVFERNSLDRGFMKTVDVNQREFISFILYPLFGSKKEEHYNPNKETPNVVIFNLVAGEIGEKIKEMDAKGNKSIFEFMGYNNNTALYRFKITDELLQN